MVDAEPEATAAEVTANMIANGCVEMGRRFQVPDLILAKQMLAAAAALLAQASSRSVSARIMRGIASHLENAYSDGRAHDVWEQPAGRG